MKKRFFQFFTSCPFFVIVPSLTIDWSSFTVALAPVLQSQLVNCFYKPMTSIVAVVVCYRICRLMCRRRRRRRTRSSWRRWNLNCSSFCVEWIWSNTFSVWNLWFSWSKAELRKFTWRNRNKGLPSISWKCVVAFLMMWFLKFQNYRTLQGN